MKEFVAFCPLLTLVGCSPEYELSAMTEVVEAGDVVIDTHDSTRNEVIEAGDVLTPELWFRKASVCRRSVSLSWWVGLYERSTDGADQLTEQEVFYGLWEEPVVSEWSMDIDCVDGLLDVESATPHCIGGWCDYFVRSTEGQEAPFCGWKVLKPGVTITVGSQSKLIEADRFPDDLLPFAFVGN